HDQAGRAPTDCLARHLSCGMRPGCNAGRADYGGTTAAGIGAADAEGFSEALQEALLAAREKARAFAATSGSH
ncbi:hypothetical protein WCE10_22020, partial [Cronobacter muytjensii]|uniref:hypothetical protein n=1 Tax=Cronobacter muytjensii TaxID=413501 RepID=UPI0034D41603